MERRVDVDLLEQQLVGSRIAIAMNRVGGLKSIIAAAVAADGGAATGSGSGKLDQKHWTNVQDLVFKMGGDKLAQAVLDCAAETQQRELQNQLRHQSARENEAKFAAALKAKVANPAFKRILDRALLAAHRYHEHPFQSFGTLRSVGSVRFPGLASFFRF